MKRPRLSMIVLALSLAAAGLAGAVWIATVIHESDADHQLTALGAPLAPAAGRWTRAFEGGMVDVAPRGSTFSAEISK